jgi:hypothetical protein
VLPTGFKRVPRPVAADLSREKRSNIDDCGRGVRITSRVAWLGCHPDRPLTDIMRRTENINALAINHATRDGESWSGIREDRGDAQMSSMRLPGRADRRGRSCRAPRCGWAIHPHETDHAVRLPTSQTRCADEPSEARRCRSCRHDRPGRSPGGTVTHGITSMVLNSADLASR